MGYIKLIHWKEEEASERAERITVCGYEVDSETPNNSSALRAMRKSPPQAVVIDLTRLPSRGWDVALALRTSPATRHVPIVFVEGEPEKVARTKTLLPDATYTRWSRIKTLLEKVLANPLANPVVPDSVLAGYSGTPLPKKIGDQSKLDVSAFERPPRVHGYTRRAAGRCDDQVDCTRTPRIDSVVS